MPTPSDPARTRTHTGLSSGPACTIDDAPICPAFADPSGDLWFTQDIPPSMPGPFSNTRFRGGILFTCPDGAGMTPGELCFGDTFTSGPYAGFVPLLHVRGTRTRQNGARRIQPIRGEPESAHMPQAAMCRADVNPGGIVSVQDIFDFLSLYFIGCA